MKKIILGLSVLLSLGIFAKEKYQVESSMNKGENKEASKRIVKPILLRSNSNAFTPLTQSFLLVIPTLLLFGLLAVVYYWLI
mgnify:CR=1 FL=1